MSGKVVDNCHAAFFAVFAWLRWLFVPCSAFPIDYVYRVTIYLWVDRFWAPPFASPTADR